jgi:hypothetical protein
MNDKHDNKQDERALLVITGVVEQPFGRSRATAAAEATAAVAAAAMAIAAAATAAVTAAT